MGVLDNVGMGPKREVFPNPDGSVVVQVTPSEVFMPGAPPARVLLTRDQFAAYSAWREGRGLIHELLPDVSPRNRDLLMSGTSL